MSANALESIESLLSSADADEVRRGLAEARSALRSASPKDAEKLFEMVSALFYVDPFERPDLAPVLDEAITTVAAGFGPDFIPALLDHLDAGDVKAQIAVGHALGRMGAAVVRPLVRAYRATSNADRRSFILYALGKVSSASVAGAAPVAVAGAGSPDRELRDTATRTIGKLAESIPAGAMAETTRRSLVEALQRNLADPSAAIRAKAVRSLGKLARHGHLTGEERADLVAACRRIAGLDEAHDWDRAYVVRKQAEEALRHLREREVDASHPVLAGR